MMPLSILLEVCLQELSYPLTKVWCADVFRRFSEHETVPLGRHVVVCCGSPSISDEAGADWKGNT